MARLTYLDIKNFTDDDIKNMGKSQRADLLRQIRAKTQMRLKQLEKASSVYSPAKENFEKKYEYRPISKMNANDLYREINIHRDFHRAQTSSVAGARKVATEQDKRIFGINEKTGRPKHRMTKEQRRTFWSIYDEFLKQKKTAENIYGSNKIQQYLGDIHTRRGLKSHDNEISVDDLEKLLAALKQSMEEEAESEDGISAANVFSGRRSH